MTTLTDRYVAATLRSVPEKSRTDIERELRASIADALEAHLARGETREAAETAVLTELGDPSRLAAEYAGPPQYLIGPGMYQPYVRTLGVVLVFAVPAVWSLVLAVWVAGGDSLANSVLTASVAALFVALLAAFWTTVGYAAVERSEDARREMSAALGVTPGPWTPDRLPAATSLRPIRVGDAVETIVGSTIGIAFLFVQRSVSPFGDAAGHPITVLSPDLWSFWIPAMVAVSVAWIATQFVTLVRGTWTAGTALALTVIALIYGAIYVYLLATGQLLNTAFFDKFGAAPWVEAGSIPVLLMILATAIDSGTRIARAWGIRIGKGRG